MLDTHMQMKQKCKGGIARNRGELGRDDSAGSNGQKRVASARNHQSPNIRPSELADPVLVLTFFVAYSLDPTGAITTLSCRQPSQQLHPVSHLDPLLSQSRSHLSSHHHTNPSIHHHHNARRVGRRLGQGR